VTRGRRKGMNMIKSVHGIDRGLFGGLLALFLYIAGGVATFGGLALVGLYQGRDLFGLGDAGSFGWVLVSVGLCASISGVLFMRIVRNRIPG